MSKHSPTFALVAIIAGTLMFCGVTGIIGIITSIVFTVFVILFLISLLSHSYKSTASLRITHRPFSRRS
ncbi:MAG: DUF1328 domain-containing protein [Opitutales bacterium]|jgi:uncharacterized membrane protein YtjA (UPF0391 family)